MDGYGEDAEGDGQAVPGDGERSQLDEGVDPDRYDGVPHGWRQW